MGALRARLARADLLIVGRALLVGGRSPAVSMGEPGATAMPVRADADQPYAIFVTPASPARSTTGRRWR
jgi:hypothetical protein